MDLMTKNKGTILETYPFIGLLPFVSVLFISPFFLPSLFLSVFHVLISFQGDESVEENQNPSQTERKRRLL